MTWRRKQVLNIDLDSILSEFSAAEGDPARAFEVLKRIGRALGYDHAIAAYATKTGQRGSSFLASTYSQKWMTEQSEIPVEQALQDPIVNHLNSRVEPIFGAERTTNAADYVPSTNDFEIMVWDLALRSQSEAPTGKC